MLTKQQYIYNFKTNHWPSIQTIITFKRKNLVNDGWIRPRLYGSEDYQPWLNEMITNPYERQDFVLKYGPITINYGFFIKFENKDDAVLFKLRWG